VVDVQGDTGRIGELLELDLPQPDARAVRAAAVGGDPELTSDGRKRAMANGVKFGRKPKLSPFQRAEALKRRAAGETLASIAKSYAVDISMISRLN
jgi:hypothetical protein